MNTRFDVTLDNCHEEPIHRPQSIQPHGMFLALHQETLNVAYASRNASDIFQKPLKTILQLSAQDLLQDGIVKNLREVVSQAECDRINPVTVDLPNSGEQLQLIVSCNEDYLLLDFEPFLDFQMLQTADYYHSIRNLNNQLVNLETLEEIFSTTVNEVRALTGFDRVMLYRFDDNYNGEVVAESKIESLNSYLKQHFPESDIPAQARELYLRNRIRLFANVDAVPEPIFPDDRFIDLSSSTLRSVSPIHGQYLRNMGVQASMSISIVVEDKLWGLIACHHYAPHIVPFQVREIATHLGMAVSHLITVKTRAQARMVVASLQTINAALSEKMANAEDFVAALRREHQLLCELVNADGVTWRLDKDLESFGVTPPDDVIHQIFDWIKSQELEDESIYFTDNLFQASGKFAHIAADASGILVLPISVKERKFLMWFRKEVIHTKNWGGKPEKIIEFLDDGSHRLMPRKSFELWKENVKNTSHGWQQVEVSTALNFRNTVVNYELRRTEQISAQNRKLERMVGDRTSKLMNEITQREMAQAELTKALQSVQASNRELEQFAYVASHDLQEPLRKIQSFGNRLQHQLTNGGVLDERGLDYLNRLINASKRMQLLIQDLLTFSRVSKKSKPQQCVKIKPLVQDLIADIELGDNESQVSIDVTDIDKVSAEPQQLYRLFLNMLQNAIKFRSPDRPCQIRITQHSSTTDDITISVQDNGIGFEQKYAEKIFELFERLHSRKSYDGTGIGLAICKKIIDQHHGTIWAESTPGEGATFFIKLPRHQRPSDSDSEEPSGG